MISKISIIDRFGKSATNIMGRTVSDRIVIQEVKDQRKHRAMLWLLVSLALILIGDFGAYLVQTDGGNVDVIGFKLPTQNGQWVTADLFRPKIASASNPVPLVVVCPGFERSKETMTSYSIELARRGIAVITIDPYSQGASSSTLQKRSASVEGYGVIPMVDYVCDTTNLDYVDKSRIGAAGYSAGGNAVLQSASRYGARQAKFLRHARAVDPNGGKAIVDTDLAQAQAENKLSSVFVGGYVLTLTNQVLKTVQANVGVDYAYYDEGAYRTENGNAHLRNAPEALRLVNAILPTDRQISEVEIGKIYGDHNDRTMRVVNNTKCIHPLMPYDKAHIANMIDFFTTVFDLKPTIASSNQIWLFKELFTLMALSGGFLFLVPFTTLLLQVQAFKSLVQPVPPAPTAPRKSGKLLFWVTFAFSACMACFLFIPMVRATAVLFPNASASIPTWCFPERINNAILLWAVANGIIGLMVFFLTYKLYGKKRGVTPDMWGIKTNFIELAKTLLLALIVFATFYGLLFISYGIFHTDFRFTFISAAASFPPKLWLVTLEYIPLFFIFYFANSIRVNGGSRFAGQKEWVSMLISGLGNSVGLMMVLAIQYSHLAATGTVFWTQEWLYANLLFGVTPLMFILPYFNRYFFRLTGKVYLGPIITCLIFIMMMLTGNVCYIPLN
jgi:Esterase FrsA-like